MIPQFQDYIKFQAERTKNHKGNPTITDFESTPFSEALELNHEGEDIEVKNEEFQTIMQADLTALSANFQNLQELNLSMNKI